MISPKDAIMSDFLTQHRASETWRTSSETKTSEIRSKYSSSEKEANEEEETSIDESW